MRKIFLLAAVTAVFLYGCGSGSTGSSSTTTTTGGTSSSAVSFASSVQPIFDTNCATTGCHTGSSPSASLDLSSGSAYANIVGISARNSSGTLVVASDSASSVIYLRINGTTSGNQMPQGASALSSTDQSTIQTWIDEGAANN